MSSCFSNVSQGSPIEVFALNKAFLDDKHDRKVNLGIGAYRTNEGKPWVLPIVKEVELKLAQDNSLNHEYLPILGLASFSEAATRLLLGNNSKAIAENRAFGIQTLSGTGALRVAAEFLANILNYSIFYYSQQTWGNHKLVFMNAGFKDNRTYRYWSMKDKEVDFEAMLEDLNQAPENSVIILHSCAHNPTGCDLNENQWHKVADVCHARKLFPFFDCAYQGFATGDVDNDAKAVRIFVDRGFELFAAQSFAKNFGLYNERVGNLTIVTSNSDFNEQIKSQLTIIVRGMYSNPPAHGARIVSEVLNSPDLYTKWCKCVSEMANRIKTMRQELFKRLQKLNTPGKWDHIISQIGMFSYTGLNEQQCEYIINKYHVYLLRNGRINMCGLTSNNIDYVAETIHETVIHFESQNHKL